MPSISATDRALTTAGVKPVATSASHPSAAAGTLSNHAAISSAARRGTSASDGGFAPWTSECTGGPTGTSGTPTSASRSAQSGGAHIRTSAPSSRNRTASPTSGSTPPRESYVDNSTRTSQLPFPQVLASACDYAARPGSCRKPPSALYLESGGECALPFSLIARCGRTTSSRSRAAPRTALPSAWPDLLPHPGGPHEPDSPHTAAGLDEVCADLRDPALDRAGLRPGQGRAGLGRLPAAA